MNALQRLILSRMAELDINYVEAAKRGGFKSHTTIYEIVRRDNPRTVPWASTLERLAKALDLDLDLVRAAASEAAGFKLNDITTTIDAAEDVRIVAAAMQELSPAERRQVRALVRSMLDKNDDDDT